MSAGTRPSDKYDSLTRRITGQVLHPPTRRWWLGFFLLCTALALLFLYAVMFTFTAGVGLLGINMPIAWGWPIVNVVWWIGIGHAGTLISAILLLLRQPWRNSINRFAEAMTIFAAGIAGLFPIIHLGRPELFYFLLPYPDTMGLWPQWRSPLVWDFFAIATYILVSIMFWFLGLLPDLATLRDRARSHASRVVYGVLALGWRGDARHWHHHQTAYLLLAALATPLVVSVHSIIALDFTVTLLPGYHSTIFPPYFVAGALFSGFAMVLTIAIPLRHSFHLKDMITARHLDNAAKIMLASGLFVTYGYLMEHFIAWYSGGETERHVVINRALGHYAPAYWAMLAINVLAIQPLWFRSVRSSPRLLFCIALLANVGMWLERYVIVVTSTEQSFLPGMWRSVPATWVDGALLAGSLGLFFLLMMLFLRWLPAVSIYEMREQAHETGQAP